MSWDSELDFVQTFARDLGERPPLAEASPEQQLAHSEQISRLQDLLSLIAALPPEKRPDVPEWDEVLRPLWRQLFVKGDDIDRYILADLWRGVLLEAGKIDRYLFSTVGVAAAARNFALFTEALQICTEARRICGDQPSASLISLLNVEGSIHACVGDLETSEGLFRRTLSMAKAANESALLAVPGITKADNIAAETLCILDCHLRRAHSITGPARERWITDAWKLVEEVELIPCSEGMQAMVKESRAELAILEGRMEEAKTMLLGWLGSSAEDGPYHYSLAPMYHRLLSMIAHQEGNLGEAYEWIRKGLKAVVRRSYPMEEFLLIDQAVAVIRDIQETWNPKSRDKVIHDMAQLLEDKDWYTGRPHSRNPTF